MLGPKRMLLEARDVPLGGVRGMEVHRTLPHRTLPTVGAWCFLDRFGPAPTVMRVEPHPHIGLQTVTWPLLGAVRHRDSVGSDVTLERGQLNLMTAGNGIAHSEYSLGDEPRPLDALQFWVALPEHARHEPPSFEHYADLPTVPLRGDAGEAGSATVVLGTFAEVTSPARVHTPLVGAELALSADAEVPLNSAWEHAIVLVEGTATVDGHAMTPGSMLFLGDSRDSIHIHTDEASVLFLLGGEPFTEELILWWNFAARSHEEIAQARDDWENAHERFGHVVGHGDERIPAPPLPHVRLRSRSRTV